MTKPVTKTRSVLLGGCAPAALALAGVFAPQTTAAQAFQATPSVVQGSVSIDRTVPNVDDIQVSGFDAVIDWAPDIDNSGAALTFLPNGNTAIFRGGNNEPGFAVLNRIQPTLTATPAEFAGVVQAFLTDIDGVPTVPGGFVAFYSPTGILVSGTAVFEVPQLMLTTNDVDIASFTDFATGAGPLLLSGDTSSINITNGASLTGTPEDSFFIVSSSDISMSGDAYFNGSTAYVGAIQAELTHNSGLFDIVIPLSGGTEGFSIFHSGSTGGPEPTGAGDNHIIYGVTRAAQGSTTGVSMLFGGNLGFDPATTATVAGGEIILSAGYDVSGRVVDGGQTGQGASSLFDGRGDIPLETADIFIGNVDSTSNVTALATHRTLVDAVESSSSFAGDLVIVGRQEARLDAEFGGTLSVGGDLYVSANNFGSMFNPAPTPVSGGLASVRAGVDGIVTVGGEARITADGYAEQDSDGVALGDAAGGQAQVLAESGLITLGGGVVLSADALSDLFGSYDLAGTFTGGLAQAVALEGGEISITGFLDVTARASQPDLTGPNAGVPGDVTGGTAVIGTGLNGGTFTVGTGSLLVDVTAVAGDGTASGGPGASAFGGSVTIAASPLSTFAIDGSTVVLTDAIAGSLALGGDGGSAVSGDILIQAGSPMLFDGQMFLESTATGGQGNTGGDATGGTTTLFANTSDITITAPFQVFAPVVGGDSTGTGAGGAAFGGSTVLLAVQTGALTFGGEVQVENSAFGGAATVGNGGDATVGSASVGVDSAALLDAQGDFLFFNIGQGGSSQGAAGGAGLSAPAAFDLSVTGGSTFAVGGLFDLTWLVSGGAGATGGLATGGNVDLLIDGSSAAAGAFNAEMITAAGSSSGTNAGSSGLSGDFTVQLANSASFSVSGTSAVSIVAEGGSAVDAEGGTATGGDISLLAETGGAFDFGAVDAVTLASGGASANATSGVGTGGNLAVSLQGGATFDSSQDVRLTTSALDGTGAVGGGAVGGSAALSIDASSSMNVAGLAIGSTASGLAATNGDGGDAVAGSVTASVFGALVAGDLALASEGEGGGSVGGNGGLGTSANVDLINDGGLLSVTNSVQVASFAFGGDALDPGLEGGDGVAGAARLGTSNGGETTLGSVEIVATGQGGASLTNRGGEGVGGSALLDIDGTGSALSVSGTTSVAAEGIAGASGSGFVSASQGGIADILVQTQALADLADTVALSAQAFGGNASGGNAGFAITNADVTSAAMNIDASATAGSSGGSSSAGSAVLRLSGGSLTMQGDLRLAAIGTGADSAGTSPGGEGTGGIAALLLVQGSTFNQQSGNAELFVDALGGSAVDAAGGAALSGDASVLVDESIADFVGSLLLSGSAVGGDSANGTGGEGTSSPASLSLDLLNGSTATIGGIFSQSAIGIGGDGVDGGIGRGGSAGFLVDGSTLNLAGTDLNAEGLGGNATSGAGGDGFGGTITGEIVDGTVTAAADQTYLAAGQGGDTATGTGGNGLGGTAQIVNGGGIFNAPGGGLAISTNGLGGSATGSGGSGGDGSGGDSIVLTQGGGTSAFLRVNLEALAIGGASADGGGGAATGGNALIELLGGSTAAVGDDLLLQVRAVGGTSGVGAGGQATGGSATVDVGGALSELVVAGGVSLLGDAVSSAGANALGGQATIAAAAGGNLQAGQASLVDLDASNGQQNAAGTFAMQALDGTIELVQLDISAIGDVGSGDPSTLFADNGTITITDALVADLTGDVVLETANGGTILGGAGQGNLTATFDITSQGTIVLVGDNASIPSIGSSSLVLTSSDIEVGPLTSIEAATVELVSLDTVNTNVIGGTAGGPGWTLTDAEGAAFSPTSITITLPATPNAVDAEIRDVQAIGSLEEDLTSITVISGGTLAVVGQIDFIAAAPTDTLSLTAAETLQVLLPDGGISITDDTGALSGALTLTANGVLMTTDAIAATILANPFDPAIPDTLDDPSATGVTGAFSYISAGSVAIEANEYVYGQNTGDADNLAGIEVALGGAGLSITQIDAVAGDPPLSAVVYGQATGSTNDVFERNNEFFFSTLNAGSLTGPFDDAATLNNCLINAADCRILVPTPNTTLVTDPPNNILLREPLDGNEADEIEEFGAPSVKVVVGTSPSADEVFGAEFPALFDADILREDERVTDPVTSGGDSALYSLETARDSQDNEEGDD